jgi:hypothetical protein
LGTHFGDGTFKQRLLEHIIDECEQEGYDMFRGAEETMEVVSHLASIAFRRDKALSEMYEQAKDAARRELMAKLQ